MKDLENRWKRVEAKGTIAGKKKMAVCTLHEKERRVANTGRALAIRTLREAFGVGTRWNKQQEWTLMHIGRLEKGGRGETG